MGRQSKYKPGKRKRILILGATSEVAMELGRLLLKQGYELTMAGRKILRLVPFQSEAWWLYGNRPALLEIDIEKDNFVRIMKQHRAEDYDILLVMVGYMAVNESKIAGQTTMERIIHVNFMLPALFISKFAEKFAERGYGMIAGVSSVAGERGRASNTVYGSAKAGFSTYLDGLRASMYKKGVHVLKIVPGFMKTKMLKDIKTPDYITQSPQNAARIIYEGISKKKNTVYIDWKWRWIMLIIKLIPNGIFKRLPDF